MTEHSERLRRYIKNQGEWNPTHLTMDVTSETAAGQQEALAIFRSVELSRQ